MGAQAHSSVGSVGGAVGVCPGGVGGATKRWKIRGPRTAPAASPPASLTGSFDYAPDDPTVFVLDVETERRSWKRDMTVDAVGVLIVATAAMVGVVAL
ncbi:hypothetical protein [Streptomyces sp. NPDC102437]|uniref:hypothetical protein n=1 Tax=Streptomyces sp. NPDC102437 TaxID=3366175 RepID=UPI003807D998